MLRAGRDEQKLFAVGGESGVVIALARHAELYVTSGSDVPHMDGARLIGPAGTIGEATPAVREDGILDLVERVGCNPLDAAPIRRNEP